MAISGAISGRQPMRPQPTTRPQQIPRAAPVQRPQQPQQKQNIFQRGISTIGRGASALYQKAAGPADRKFFQGSILNKAFDVLQSGEYALAGFWKGAQEEKERTISKFKETGYKPSFGKRVFKGLGSGLRNILPAFKSRTEIGSTPGDFDAARRIWGLKGKVADLANLGLALAVPAPPIGKIAKGIRKLPLASKLFDKVSDVAKTASKFAKQDPRLYKPIEAFSPFFRNPAFGKKLVEAEARTTKRVGRLFRNLKEVTKDLTRADQVEIGKLIEAGPEARKLARGKLSSIAENVSNFADEVGMEAVEAKFITLKTFEEHKGYYMTHIWDNIERGTFDTLKGVSPEISKKFFQARKGAKGYVKEFAPAVFKGLGTEIKDIESARFYKNIAEEYGVNLGKTTDDMLFKAATEGYKSADDIAQLKSAKSLRGLLVPPEIHDYLKATVPKTSKNFVLRIYDAVFNTWKAVKTIWNPAYHMRNVMSNQILSDMSTGRGIPQTIIDYVGSVANYFGKGNQAFVNAAEDAGLIRRVNFGVAFNELLDSAYELERKKGLKGAAQSASEFVRNFQNSTEETSKLGVFKAWVEKYADDVGLAAEDALSDADIVKRAAAEAEKAIFSPYKIAQQERALVGRIIPFYSFTRQAIPFTAETYVKRPGTLAKYPKLKTGIEGFSKDIVPEKDRPEYARGHIQLPIKIDGKRVSFDPTYIYPFGNFGDSDISRGQLPGGLSITPFAMEPIQQIFNKDLYFDQKIEKTQLPGVGKDVFSVSPQRQGSQRLAHALRTFEPAAATILRGKLAPAFQGVPDYAGRDRNKMMAVFDAIGFKTVVLRPTEKKKWDKVDKRKKLQQIQKEKRALRRNKRFSPEQKKIFIQEYNEEYRKTLSN